MRKHDMDPEDIKSAVRKAGASLAVLGRENDMHRQTLSAALHTCVSPRAEQIIADFLGLHPMTIWPSRYSKTGKRLTRLEQRRNAA